MSRSVRVYNPGRDTRWGSSRAPARTVVSLIALGSAQRPANDHALAATGQPLPWKTWPKPVGEMHPLQVRQVQQFLDSAPDLNRLRRIDGRVFWCLRVPDWFMEEITSTEELPGDPVDMPPALRRQIVAELEDAHRRGLLADPTTRAMAASIGFALLDQQGLGQALRERIAPEHLATGIRLVAAIVPAVGQLAEYAR